MKFWEKIQVVVLAAALVWGLQWMTGRLDANNVSYPSKNFTFTGSTVISSSQVNSNFDQLFNELGGNVGTANILDDAISTAKIINLAVTTGKVNDLAVTTGKINDLAVTTGKLAAGAVTNAKVTGNGNSAQYLSGAATWSTPAGIVPTGTISAFAGDTAPTGYLLCYGQAVSRATYAGLLSVIGCHYGSGDGSTTFNVPDLRGRSVAGLDNMGGSAASRLTATYFGAAATTRGTTGGLEYHALTEAQTAAHTHTGPSHTHTGPSHTHSGPAHTHTGPSHAHTMAHTHDISHVHQYEYNLNTTAFQPGAQTSIYNNAFTDTAGANPSTSGGSSAANTGSDGTAATGSSGTGLTGAEGTGATGASGTGASGSTGSGSGHNNIQPTCVLNYVIKH